MTVGSVVPGLRILPADVPAAESAAGARPTEATFGEELERAVSGVDSQARAAQAQVAAVMEGNGTDVHDAMIAVQKADLSFQLMLQVRNKVVQAYQEIERMQF